MSDFGFPSNWSIATLGDIARRKASNGIFRKSNEYLNSTENSDGLPVVWLDELFSGNAIDCSNARRLRPTAKEIENYGLQRGDLLFCRSSLNQEGIGYSNVYTGEDWTSLFECHLIRISPNLSIADPYYLNHYLRSASARRFIKSRAKTSTMTTIDQGGISAIPVPLPPLPEQRRIAAILDKADALRTKRREALAQLDRLAQSIFVEMFGDPATNPKGWPVSRIGDLLESASYGTSEKSDTSGQFPVLRMNNITRTGEMDFTDLKYMDLDASEHERYLVKAGDVLFNRTNSAELVGKTSIYREAEPMAYAGYLVRLRTNADNDPEYLAAFMNTPYTKRVLRGMCKSIIGMANINATEVQNIKIAQPPLELQVQFRERIESLNQVKTSHRAMLAELDGLFSSIQHRAFRGEL